MNLGETLNSLTFTWICLAYAITTLALGELLLWFKRRRKRK